MEEKEDDSKNENRKEEIIINEIIEENKVEIDDNKDNQEEKEIKQDLEIKKIKSNEVKQTKKSIEVIEEIIEKKEPVKNIIIKDNKKHGKAKEISSSSKEKENLNDKLKDALINDSKEEIIIINNAPKLGIETKLSRNEKEINLKEPKISQYINDKYNVDETGENKSLENIYQPIIKSETNNINKKEIELVEAHIIEKETEIKNDKIKPKNELIEKKENEINGDNLEEEQMVIENQCLKRINPESIDNKKPFILNIDKLKKNLDEIDSFYENINVVKKVKDDYNINETILVNSNIVQNKIETIDKNFLPIKIEKNGQNENEDYENDIKKKTEKNEIDETINIKSNNLNNDIKDEKNKEKKIIDNNNKNKLKNNKTNEILKETFKEDINTIKKGETTEENKENVLIKNDGNNKDIKEKETNEINSINEINKYNIKSAGNKNDINNNKIQKIYMPKLDNDDINAIKNKEIKKKNVIQITNSLSYRINSPIIDDKKLYLANLISPFSNKFHFDSKYNAEEAFQRNGKDEINNNKFKIIDEKKEKDKNRLKETNTIKLLPPLTDDKKITIYNLDNNLIENNKLMYLKEMNKKIVLFSNGNIKSSLDNLENIENYLEKTNSQNKYVKKVDNPIIDNTKRIKTKEDKSLTSKINIIEKKNNIKKFNNTIIDNKKIDLFDNFNEHKEKISKNFNKLFIKKFNDNIRIDNRKLYFENTNDSINDIDKLYEQIISKKDNNIKFKEQIKDKNKVLLSDNLVEYKILKDNPKENTNKNIEKKDIIIIDNKKEIFSERENMGIINNEVSNSKKKKNNNRRINKCKIDTKKIDLFDLAIFNEKFKDIELKLSSLVENKEKLKFKENEKTNLQTDNILRNKEINNYMDNEKEKEKINKNEGKNKNTIEIIKKEKISKTEKPDETKELNTKMNVDDKNIESIGIKKEREKITQTNDLEKINDKDVPYIKKENKGEKKERILLENEIKNIDKKIRKHIQKITLPIIDSYKVNINSMNEKIEEKNIDEKLIINDNIKKGVSDINKDNNNNINNKLFKMLQQKSVSDNPSLPQTNNENNIFISNNKNIENKPFSMNEYIKGIKDEKQYQPVINDNKVKDEKFIFNPKEIDDSIPYNPFNLDLSSKDYNPFIKDNEKMNNPTNISNTNNNDINKKINDLVKNKEKMINNNDRKTNETNNTIKNKIINKEDINNNNINKKENDIQFKLFNKEEKMKEISSSYNPSKRQTDKGVNIITKKENLDKNPFIMNKNLDIEKEQKEYKSMIDNKNEKDDKLKINNNEIGQSISCNLNISNKNDNKKSNVNGNKESIILTNTTNINNNSDINGITIIEKIKNKESINDNIQKDKNKENINNKEDINFNISEITVQKGNKNNEQFNLLNQIEEKEEISSFYNQLNKSIKTENNNFFNNNQITLNKNIENKKDIKVISDKEDEILLPNNYNPFLSINIGSENDYKETKIKENKESIICQSDKININNKGNILNSLNPKKNPNIINYSEKEIIKEVPKQIQNENIKLEEDKNKVFDEIKRKTDLSNQFLNKNYNKKLDEDNIIDEKGLINKKKEEIDSKDTINQNEELNNNKVNNIACNSNIYSKKRCKKSNEKNNISIDNKSNIMINKNKEEIKEKEINKEENDYHGTKSVKTEKYINKKVPSPKKNITNILNNNQSSNKNNLLNNKNDYNIQVEIHKNDIIYNNQEKKEDNKNNNKKAINTILNEKKEFEKSEEKKKNEIEQDIKPIFSSINKEVLNLNKNEETKNNDNFLNEKKKVINLFNSKDISQIKKEDKSIKVKEDKIDKNILQQKVTLTNNEENLNENKQIPHLLQNENKISEKEIKNHINKDAYIPSITILKVNSKENDQIIIPNIEKANKEIIVNENEKNLVEKKSINIPNEIAEIKSKKLNIDCYNNHNMNDKEIREKIIIPNIKEETLNEVNRDKKMNDFISLSHQNNDIIKENEMIPINLNNNNNYNDSLQEKKKKKTFDLNSNKNKEKINNTNDKNINLKTTESMVDIEKIFNKPENSNYNNNFGFLNLEKNVSEKLDINRAINSINKSIFDINPESYNLFSSKLIDYNDNNKNESNKNDNLLKTKSHNENNSNNKPSINLNSNTDNLINNLKNINENNISKDKGSIKNDAVLLNNNSLKEFKDSKIIDNIKNNVNININKENIIQIKKNKQIKKEEEKEKEKEKDRQIIKDKEIIKKIKDSDDKLKEKEIEVAFYPTKTDVKEPLEDKNIINKQLINSKNQNVINEKTRTKTSEKLISPLDVKIKDNMNDNILLISPKFQNKKSEKEYPSQFDINLEYPNYNLLNNNNKNISLNASNECLNTNKLNELIKANDNNFCLNNLDNEASKENMNDKKEVSELNINDSINNQNIKLKKKNENIINNNISISQISDNSLNNKIQSSLMSNLSKDSDDIEKSNIKYIDNKKEGSDIKLKKQTVYKYGSLDLDKFNIKENDQLKQFIRYILIDKIKKIIIFTTLVYNQKKGKEELEKNSHLCKININSYLRILQLMSSNKKEEGIKIGIQHYKGFIFSLTNYFKEWKKKVKNKINSNNSNINDKSNTEIKNGGKEGENSEKVITILIDEFIRKINYIKRLYIYILIKKHYCKDIKEKEKIIKEGSNGVDIANKELDIIKTKLLSLLKKIKGDSDLIKYITLIIIKLKNYKNISEKEIKEFKTLYRQNINSFEILKEENLNNEKVDKVILREKGNKEITQDELEEKNNLLANKNERSKLLYRIWGAVIPLLYIAHYFYFNFKSEYE